jgi:branched-chain amino acid transport system permease protein
VAQTVKLRGRRRVQLPVLDAFLWGLRVGAVVLIVVGSYNSLTSGRLTPESWQDLVVFGLSQGAVYALIALGYTMVYGVLRFINFAHGEVFMAGAMIGFFVADGLARTGLWQSPIVVLPVVLIASMATSALVALGLERVAYRPLRGAPRLIPFITAIGASFFLQYAFAGLFGTDVKAWPPVSALQGAVIFLGVRILKVHSVVMIAAIVMMVGLYLFLGRTRTGKAMRAVSEDQETAQLMGIDVDRTIALVFAVGGALAGAGGFLWGLVFGEVFFFTGFFPGIKAFTAAVLGGIGNPVGAMLGGLTLGVVESVGPLLVLSGLGVPAAFQLKDLVAYMVLILVLIFRPTGLLGERLAQERA